ncbi:uncharacterized protein RMCC_2552 [Mycolicibacterium canariasense]|uniref:Xylose isomerase n=1 Tax=Mycolicibacterium canariasense TaxID=228230 RepID=A0A100WCE9_MYCCR|nr:sugar phosphate isomerase/epimerase [Mycolicibacterium canariasense]MCV7212553.1 sugar phosphate isomerase/epimerase [Mycolicibacterium canariasense]ORV05383.1 hypothetical protein AWB94_20070 [Mycolicibacterium canariasense]GAS95586.1 uncharacterized protein RMCC_2552 [Mycolicibacterium canariasense]
MTELQLYQSMWAMEDLPWRGAPWTLSEQLAWIAGAGYTGIGVDLGARRAPSATDIAPLLAEHRLRGCVLVFATSDDDIREAIRYARAIRADWIICCARVFGFDAPRLANLLSGWHRMCADAGIEMELETHRNTVTNDLRFTCMLLEDLDDSIELAADLSHYVCAHEIPEAPEPEYESLVATILDRSGSLQGRIATRAQIQVPLAHPMAQPWEPRFRDWWTRGFESLLRRHPDRPARFLTELGTTPYAITDAQGVQISDRWAESLTLMRWAADAFDAALGARPATAP